VPNFQKLDYQYIKTKTRMPGSFKMGQMVFILEYHVRLKGKKPANPYFIPEVLLFHFLKNCRFIRNKLKFKISTSQEQ
jgi:hypothetical protein